MPLTDQIGAYTDCFDIWNRALADPTGVRVLVSTQSQAFMLQMRLNHSRKLEREQSKRIYTKTDPQWNTSEFDPLIVRVKPTAEGDGWWVYIERHGTEIMDIETLSEDSANAT